MMRFLLHRGLIYILPLIGLAIAVVARVAVPDMLDRLMLISFDFYQRLAPREAGDVPIRIVDIDEAALSQYGQWPWSRSLDAELIDKLREAGAVVVALDVVFAEPDRTSPKLLLAQLSKHGEVDDETAKLLSNLPDPDERLVAALKSLPTVAGFILVDHADMPPPIAKAGYARLTASSRWNSSTATPQRSATYPISKRRRPATAFSTSMSIGTRSFGGSR